MTRLGGAFFVAVLGHLLFFYYAEIDNKVYAPEVVGRQHISVTLSQRSVVKEALVQPQEKQKMSPPVEKIIPKKKTKNAQIKPVTPPVVRAHRKKRSFEIEEQKVEVIQEVSPLPPTEELVQKDSVKKESQDTSSIVGQEVIEIVEARPMYHNNPKPKYPALAQRRGWQGTTVLAVTVLKNGKVAQVRLHESCGYGILDNSAVKAVRKWIFLPATKDGISVKMEVFIPVHFLLTK